MSINNCVCVRARVLEVRLLSMRCVLQSLYPVVECACRVNFVGLRGQVHYYSFWFSFFLYLQIFGIRVCWIVSELFASFGRIRERANFLVEIGIMKGLSL